MDFFEQLGRKAALFDGASVANGSSASAKPTTTPSLPKAPVTSPPSNAGPAKPPTSVPMPNNTQPNPPLAKPNTAPTTTSNSNPMGSFGNFMNPATLMALPGIGNILQSVLGNSPFGLVGLSAMQDMMSGQNRLKKLTEGPQTGGPSAPIT